MSEKAYLITGDPLGYPGPKPFWQYERLYGHSGRVWYVATTPPNRADYIYVTDTYEPNTPNSYRGFGGASVDFRVRCCDDVRIYTESGPWHSNAQSLYEDTESECDVRHLHYSQVVIARDRCDDLMRGVLYEEPNYRLGEYHRGDSLARVVSKRVEAPVELYQRTPNGSIRVRVGKYNKGGKS